MPRQGDEVLSDRGRTPRARIHKLVRGNPIGYNAGMVRGVAQPG